MIAWEPGSDEIGDFTWPGFDSEAVVTDAVIDGLRLFSAFEPGAVVVAGCRPEQEAQQGRRGF